MNRIQKTYADLKKARRKALTIFVTAGDPDATTSQRLLNALPAHGADVIEIGMPFTDPMADGPAIQTASQRALQHGANMVKTLAMIRSFRATDQKTPIVLMGYYNPIYIYGTERFAADAAQAGVDGLIVVDLPPEEDEELNVPARKYGLEIIRLVTPTTDEARLEVILNGAGGFLYYVSITGVTGTARPDPNQLRPHLDQIRRKTGLPIAVGFGIRTPEDAASMAQIADGVVVGSAIVDTVGAMANGTRTIEDALTQVSALATSMKA